MSAGAVRNGNYNQRPCEIKRFFENYNSNIGEGMGISK